MNTPIIFRPRWSTASFGASADTLPMELAALQAHMTLCKTSHARLHAIHRLAQNLHGFVAARFVTTLVVLSVLMLFTSLVI
jgi:hypothetical protein